MIISERNVKMGSCLFFFLLISITLWSLPVAAVGPVVSETMVTDVTTRSFSVIWKTDVPSTAGLKVFNGSDCTEEITGAVNIIPHPTISGDDTIRTAAEDSGIMKVMVTGLAADSEYCYQTETTAKGNTSMVTVHPPEPGKVLTEVMTVRTYVDVDTSDILPFSNDLIVFPVYDPDGVSPSEGSLLLAQVNGSTVTAFVGDGITSPDSVSDLNNLFLDGENMDCQGEEILKLSEFRGVCTLDRFRKVPADTGLSAVVEPAPCFDPADLDCNDFINVFDLLRAAGKLNSQVGDACYNSDFNQDTNPTINVFDLLKMAGKLNTQK